MKHILRLIQSNWLLISIAIIVAITVGSLYPIENLPSVPGSDKTHHIIGYGVLAFPVALAKPNKWLFIIAGYLAYSGAIELIQPYVNRYGEWLDLGANALGLIAGIVFAGIASFLIQNIKKQIE